ncbi:hypothetical protein BH23CHL8_BH23CHL8_08040 [soil metagenome]
MTIAGAEVDVSHTGYTGDLGYELWLPRDGVLPVWDALMEAGASFALRPVGILALDVARIEAGLIMAQVDYVSVRHAEDPGQAFSPFEIGPGRLVDLDKAVPFVGRRPLRDEHSRGGPPRCLVGLDLAWDDLDRLFARHHLLPALPVQAWRHSHGWTGTGDRRPCPTTGRASCRHP